MICLVIYFWDARGVMGMYIQLPFLQILERARCTVNFKFCFSPKTKPSIFCIEQFFYCKICFEAYSRLGIDCFSAGRSSVNWLHKAIGGITQWHLHHINVFKAHGFASCYRYLWFWRTDAPYQENYGCRTVYMNILKSFSLINGN